MLIRFFLSVSRDMPAHLSKDEINEDDAKNSLTADLKPFYAFHAGRVGWRGVEKIRLAVIGSARR